MRLQQLKSKQSLQSYGVYVSPWLCILTQPKKIMLHEDQFGGPALCLAVLHLATAEDRFSWGVLALRVNVHGWRQGKITGAEK